MRDRGQNPVISEHQQFEQTWWGSCVSTFGEESKQLTYAHRMGLENVPVGGRWPCYDLAGRSVVDLGGGPVSMLLKTVNGAQLFVVDPCPYPDWVRARYEAHGIEYVVAAAESFGPSGSEDPPHRDFDEGFIYNTLQHVRDPESVLATARMCARTLRIFEWLETPPSPGHPHTLHCDELNRWIGNGANGKVEIVDENGAVGLCYYGVFDL